MTNWKGVLKAKKKSQQDLTDWTNENWGSQKQHKAKAKGKTPLLKPKEDICLKVNFNQQNKAHWIIKTERKRKAERKANNMSQQERSLLKKAKGGDLQDDMV